MAQNKLRVGVLFGGRSGEHEVSLLSAASVMKAMDRNKYEVVPIGITKQGLWLTDLHAERTHRVPSEGDLVVTRESPVERMEKIMSLVVRDRTHVVRPVIRKHMTGAILIEPADVLVPTQEYPAQDQSEHPMRMRLCIGQRQCGPP